MSSSNEYPIKYTSDVGQAVAGIDLLISRLKALDAAVDRVAPKLKDVAKGAATPLGAAGRSAQALAGRFQNLGNAASQAGSEIRQTATAAVQLGGHLGGVGTAARGAGGGLGAMAAKGLLVGGVVQVARSLGAEFARIREDLRAMGEEAIRIRDSMREVGVLRGKGGATDEVTAGTIEFGVQAGLKPDEAREYMEQYLGSAPAGREKGNITPEVEQGLALEGAKFGARNKLDEKTAGDLAGSISQYGKIESVEKGAEVLGRVLFGLTEGRGNSEPLTRALINTAGAVVEETGGPIRDLEGLSVAMGVASTHHNPTAAGTYLKKAIRELRQVDPKTAQGQALRKMGFTGDEEYLSSADDANTVDEKMDALHMIAPVILAADRSGKGGDNALRDMGFKDEAAIQAIVEQARDLDVIDARMKARKAITGRSVMRADEDFFTKDLAGLNRKAEAADAASRYVEGHKQERALIARKNALTRMRDSGELTDADNVIADKAIDAVALTGLLSLPSHLEMRVGAEAHDELKREFVNAGGDPNDPRLRLADAAGNPRSLADVFNSGVVEETLGKGGQPLGKTGGVALKLRALARDPAKKAAADAMKGPHPAAVPVARPGARVPVARGPADAAGPAAGGGAAAGAGGADPEMKQLLRQQLDEHKKLNRQVAANRPAPARPPGPPPLPADVDTSGPGRRGG